MKTKKIVITGGPGTGKTSIIKALEEKGHSCLHEVSRQITREAQEKGIDQLFLTEPLLFSELLLEGRIKQHQQAVEALAGVIFLDRGIPDVVAYMDYFGNDYPPVFSKVCRDFPYDLVFILPPWEEIYTSDNERYESFEQAKLIHSHLEESYRKSGYSPIDVPIGNVHERASFILEQLQK